MKFLVALQFLPMLLMSAPAVKATCCIGAEIFEYKTAGCLDLNPPHAVLAIGDCLPLATKIASFRGNLKAFCLPTDYTCYLTAFVNSDCTGTTSLSLSVKPLTSACQEFSTLGAVQAGSVNFLCVNAAGDEVKSQTGCTCSGA